MLRARRYPLMTQESMLCPHAVVTMSCPVFHYAHRCFIPFLFRGSVWIFLHPLCGGTNLTGLGLAFYFLHLWWVTASWIKMPSHPRSLCWHVHHSHSSKKEKKSLSSARWQRMRNRFFLIRSNNWLNTCFWLGKPMNKPEGLSIHVVPTLRNQWRLFCLQHLQ